jgi:hypothetical protein
MTASITIRVSPEVLQALQTNQTITLALTSGNGGAPTASALASAPRAGSIPARILEWAEARGKTFRTADIERKFKLKRAHASMVLSRLANGSTSIRRVQRGVFAHGGAAPAAPGRAQTKTGGGQRSTAKEPREGSLPARVLDWAQKRGKPFGNAEIEKRFKLTRAHASMVTSTLANGPYPIRRKERGVYEFAG